MVEILSLLMLSFAMGLGIESVPDLLPGLANCLYAVSDGMSFAMSLRIFVHNLNPCFPELLLVNIVSAITGLSLAIISAGPTESGAPYRGESLEHRLKGKISLHQCRPAPGP
ncbi:hypothetical protein MRB53_034746 [Persea americana]|uniref:Uncharacterized protein n=1 Tax=Persea americana TaxID=3435 RepID=A0ACC2K2Y7_PERAE|nr:hypothetical protein MRB53_034746 [Persea americana]